MTTEDSMENMHDVLKEYFENEVFNKRFLASIVKTNRPGPIDFMSVGCPFQEDLMRKDDNGNYLDQYVSAMWYGFSIGINYSQAELDRRVADHYSDGYLSEDEVIGLLGKLTDAMGRNVDDFDSDAGFLGCCERLVDSAVEYIAEVEERQRDQLAMLVNDIETHVTLGNSANALTNLAKIRALLNAGRKGDE